MNPLVNYFHYWRFCLQPGILTSCRPYPSLLSSLYFGYPHATKTIVANQMSKHGTFWGLDSQILVFTETEDATVNGMTVKVKQALENNLAQILCNAKSPFLKLGKSKLSCNSYIQ